MGLKPMLIIFMFLSNLLIIIKKIANKRLREKKIITTYRCNKVNFFKKYSSAIVMSIKLLN